MAEALADPAGGRRLDRTRPTRPRTPAAPYLDRRRGACGARKLTDMADALEPLLVYAWRRHLTAAISRMLADADPPSSPHQGVRRSRRVRRPGHFTSLVRRMTERQLAAVVQRFEALATDIVTAHGGRVIKTVGDEILFVTIDAAPAAAIALDLVETMAEDDLLPDVRVGMAIGPVVSRLGDVFGTTVNRASRLTSVARPGRCSSTTRSPRALASALAGSRRPRCARRTLRGIGPVTPCELRRAAGGRRGEPRGTPTCRAPTPTRAHEQH